MAYLFLVRRMKVVAVIHSIPLLAEGGGAAVGSFFFLSLVSAFVAAGVGFNTLRKRRRSVFSFILSLVALSITAWIAYAFGFPYDWSDLGGYVPWVPVMLALCGLVLTILGAVAQSMLDTDS